MPGGNEREVRGGTNRTGQFHLRVAVVGKYWFFGSLESGVRADSSLYCENLLRSLNRCWIETPLVGILDS